MKKAMLLTTEANRELCFGPEHLAALRQMVELKDCCHLLGDLEALRPHLADVEMICSSWGMMPLDEAFLAAAPRLRAVFYAAGSVRAEFTVALMVLASKKAFLASRATARERTFVCPEDVRGMYRTRIGIIGVGQIGRRVIELLRGYEVEVFCHDPYLGEHGAAELGATPLSLEEMFRTCDVVSLHAPNIPSTEHMITGEHFRSMKPGAVFINTARGRITRQEELIEELKRGRIFACLDRSGTRPDAWGPTWWRR